MEKNVIITISRQFGSNGREIARKLAEYLDISYYNKEIIIITYYFDGKILIKEAKIKYLDKYKKQLILSDTSIIHFKQIINIKSK